jgi:hypothetical protein
MSSLAQTITNKIWTCRELNKNNVPYWNFSKLGIKFDLKLEKPYELNSIGV